VGYEPGKRLADFWALETLKPGATDFLQFADMTAHKNRMQGNDFVQSEMYKHELRCFDCHDVHSSSTSQLRLPGNQLCLSCHQPGMQGGAALKVSVEEHTHHKADSAGNLCVSCHMPRIEQTIKGNFVHAHTFRFITPQLTETRGVPNPCTSCHTDKTTVWASGQLRTWETESPWRVGAIVPALHPAR
jgi:predicted CXXCH cytochrome family protein